MQVVKKQMKWLDNLSLEQQLTTQLILQQDMTSKNYGLHAMPKEWQHLTTCRMTKIFFPRPDKKPKKLLKHGRAYM